MVANACNSSERLTLSAKGCTPRTNVIVLRQKLLGRHRMHLERWLTASEPMGILDAQVITPLSASNTSSLQQEQVVIWVRENAAPAYLVYPAGNKWVLMDALQDRLLGRFTEFSAALHAIRPVLPLS